MSEEPHARGSSDRSENNALIALVCLCVGVEAILQLGDAGVLGVARFRAVVYENGGFWAGLLRDWRPNFPFQQWTMFLTHGFLHTGILHLALNMVTLVSLSRPITTRIGGGKFALLFGISILGGGIGFALLSDSFRPMVGASGALFGLAGAILAWEYLDRFNLQERLWPVARAALLLVALNVALYYAMDRLLAWEAHLGGFVAGWFLAMLIDPSPRRE